ncbi:MAG: Na/Pi symporter [Candidatus Krumholzibacteriia bacterium]
MNPRDQKHPAAPDEPARDGAGSGGETAAARAVTHASGLRAGAAPPGLEPGVLISAARRRDGGRGEGLMRALAVFVLLYLFLLAIALLSAAFKLFGGEFSRQLIETTTNPVIGLLIGVLATSMIQSSSSTTSIVVGMVAAGALSVRGAIPIVMGANMGTTVTNTLVAMGSMGRRAEFRRAFAGATMHDFFNLCTIVLIFPLEQATRILERTATWLSAELVGTSGVEFNSPVKIITKPVAKGIEHLFTDTAALSNWLAGTLMLVLALAMLFTALTYLQRTLQTVVLKRAERSFHRYVTRGGLLAMAIGLLVTVSVQSSSITTSLLVPMIGAGIVPLESAFAVTVGANVGTTVTALLASLAGNGAAVTVALVHLLFNFAGIVLIYPIPAVRRIPIRMARTLAYRTSRRRSFAFIYMGLVFFVVPMLFVLVERLVRKTG